MDAKQVETMLKRYGFRLISQKESHRKCRNDERNLPVIVPYHKGRDLLRNILINADIPESEGKTKPLYNQENIGSLHLIYPTFGMEL